MRKKHSDTSSPLLGRNPLSKTHLLDPGSSKTTSKAIDVNEKIPDNSVVDAGETNDNYEHYELIDSAISENKTIKCGEENESRDQKKKRGRPKLNGSEKRGRGRPKGTTKVKYEIEQSHHENVETSKIRETPKRAAAQRNKIWELNQSSDSESEYEAKSATHASSIPNVKKSRGRPKKDSQATTHKKRDRSRPIRKFDEESDISTDSNSLSSESELERELERESEKDSDKDSESEPEIQLQRLPKANSSGEGCSKRGRGRPKGQKNGVQPIREEFYEVEQILGEKIEKGCHYFLVKWKNWPDNANSWEVAANINCDELIENFRSLCRSMYLNGRTAESSSTDAPIAKKSKMNDESDVIENEEDI